MKKINVKPFIKWAGGKTQLLSHIDKNLPNDLKNGKIEKYIEPFVGGGAVLFHILQNYKVKKVFINDKCNDLINCYICIKNDVNKVIKKLKSLEEEFKNHSNKSSYFTKIKTSYNSESLNKKNNFNRCAQFIFLNKTCFNGLYRVNKDGKFNVPYGKYTNPTICDKNNLISCSKLLRNVTILNFDYQQILEKCDNKTFVYFDPPYRPIKKSSSFVSYNKSGFDDNDQLKLAKNFKKVNSKGSFLMLSNSDPKNVDKNDNFFDDLYKGFNIKRVSAKRSINSKGNARGSINELLIMNYNNDNMIRNFNEWFKSLSDSIKTFNYFVNFNSVYKNVNKIKPELCLMNSLVGSKNIERDFENLYKMYPTIKKCLPALIAIRTSEIVVIDEGQKININFNEINNIEILKKYMRKTGLFDLISNHIINNLVDYVMGVEVGLDSNARKNRAGKIMEKIVENFIKKAGFIKDKTYFKQMTIEEIESKWNLDLSKISNLGKTTKRFDYVIKTPKNVYAIETNFYNTQGSKLNETARSYKLIAEESKNIDGFIFAWITDGQGWKSAKNNLEEAFDSTDKIFNINDLRNGVLNKFKH